MFGEQFAADVSLLSSADCAYEINALNRHRKTIPSDDFSELAECLTCIAHIRARQLQIALQEAEQARSKWHAESNRCDIERAAIARFLGSKCHQPPST